MMKNKPFQPWRYLVAFSLQYLAVGVFMCVNTLISLSRGLSLSQVSLGLALASLTALALELPSGMAGDLLGRKRVWLAAACVTALRVVLLLFCTGPVLLLAYVLNGAANALLSGTLDAMYMEEWIHSRGTGTLAKASAWNAAAQTGFMALGSLAGGALATVPFFRDYTVNLVVMTALQLLALFWVWRMIPADPGHRTPQSAARPSLPRQFLAQGCVALDAASGSLSLQLCLLSAAALGFGMIGLEAYWSPRLQQLAAPGAELGPLLGVLSCVSMLGALAGSLLCAKFTARCRTQRSRVLAFLITRGLHAAALAAVAFALRVPAFALLFTSYYLATGAQATANDVLLQAAAPDHVRGTLMSVQNLLVHVGTFLCEALAAFWLARGGIASFWLLEAAVLLFGTLAVGALCLALRARRRKAVENTPQNG